MRRLLAVGLVALVLGGLIGCRLVKPGPGGGTSEHSECVTGAEAAKAHRPDLITTGYLCANFGGTGWVGWLDSSLPYIEINENYTYYTPSSPAGGYYCVAAHEWGHAWDWYRLGWTHGGSGDPEAYAQLFAAVYFGC